MEPDLMYFRQREAELRAKAERHRVLQEAREAAAAESHERKGGGRWTVRRGRRSAASPASAC